MSHLDLTLEEAHGLQWLATLEDGLQLFSYFSTDLQGKSAIQNSPSISRNKYTFDFASWCRKNVEANSVVCHRGLGLDLVSSFVTDFGAQVGEYGNSKDPNKLGEQLVQTYVKTINDLDKIYIQAKENQTSTDLSFEKLKLIHQLKKSHTVGLLMWIVKVVHSCSVTLLLAFKAASKSRTVVVRNRTTALITLEIGLVLCELCTFSIMVCEILFAAILNSRLSTYGIHLRLGTAHLGFVLELILGAVVGFQALYH